METYGLQADSKHASGYHHFRRQDSLGSHSALPSDEDQDEDDTLTTLLIRARQESKRTRCSHHYEERDDDRVAPWTRVSTPLKGKQK